MVDRRGRAAVRAALSLALLLPACAGRTDTAGPGASPSPGESPAASPSPEPTPTVGQCSASGLTMPGPLEGLPEMVAETREAIAAAAIACDYEELERIGAEGGFSFTFGGAEEGAAAYWRELEQTGTERPMEWLVELLGLPYARTAPGPGSPPPDAPAGEVYYVWPRAHAHERPTDQDWAEVASVFGEELAARMRADTEEFGIGYLGYRVGILGDGNWQYFIAGD